MCVRACVRVCTRVRANARGCKPPSRTRDANIAQHHTAIASPPHARCESTAAAAGGCRGRRAALTESADGHQLVRAERLIDVRAHGRPELQVAASGYYSVAADCAALPVRTTQTKRWMQGCTHACTQATRRAVQRHGGNKQQRPSPALTNIEAVARRSGGGSLQRTRRA